MSERIRQPKKTVSDHSQGNEESSVAASIDSTDLVDELDDLLDQIDEVLESNAEEFVKNYVQKGGE